MKSAGSVAGRRPQKAQRANQSLKWQKRLPVKSAGKSRWVLFVIVLFGYSILDVNQSQSSAIAKQQTQ